MVTSGLASGAVENLSLLFNTGDTEAFPGWSWGVEIDLGAVVTGGVSVTRSRHSTSLIINLGVGGEVSVSAEIGYSWKVVGGRF